MKVKASGKSESLFVDEGTLKVFGKSKRIWWKQKSLVKVSGMVNYKLLVKVKVKGKAKVSGISTKVSTGKI